MSPQIKSWRNRAITVFCGGLFIVLLAIAAHRILLPAMMRWLDIGMTPKRSDAAFVLLGDSDSRPFVAAALYNAGLTDRILLARLRLTEDDPHVTPEQLVYKRVLLARGVPNADISLLGSGITNTMNESQALLGYMEKHPSATVTVVTSHFHTRRTRWSMRRTFGEHASRLRYVSSPHRSFDESDWWLDRKGFNLILMEFVKMLGYWVVYGKALYWAGGLIAAMAIAVAYRSRAAGTTVQSQESADSGPSK